MSEEAGTQVLLYVYDLSNGFAAQMSMALLGKQVLDTHAHRVTIATCWELVQ